ncbi:hypothetical protein DFO66_10248 [Brevibacterium sanguinis]|uniref:DUF6286 domain-containing protein n=2 Tax=Brevibacterium TaxID=1696 RepID=A0A366IP22_9MICO|nr:MULTISPECIES: DUF6286 domain-containing protein [Brevibacterium]RBP66995.1 hypothetical protein DFO66_10248 [Brevibacterium sanguinis]RBP73520.1 hypothetical protein DFO65_10248 [Brevibacterium celere]
MSRTRLRMRSARIAPAVATALVLLGLGFALGWCGVSALRAQGSPAAPLSATLTGLDALAALRWEDQPVRIAGAALAALGIILVLAGIWPGRRRIARLRAEDRAHVGRLEVGMTTAGISGIASAAARTVDGVATARARSRATSTRVVVGTPVRQSAAIRRAVEDSVLARISGIDFARPVTTRVGTPRRTS